MWEGLSFQISWSCPHHLWYSQLPLSCRTSEVVQEWEAEEDAALQAKEVHLSETPSAALDREPKRGGGGRG